MRGLFSFTAAMFAVVVCVMSFASPVAAQQPTADFERIMDTYFGKDDGMISFGDQSFAFVPEGPFNGEVAVVDPKGGVVGRFSYFEDVMRDGVFIRAKVKGIAEVKLTEPGVYTLVYLVNGKPVTRMPVKLNKVDGGDDPFNPKAMYSFDGYWRTHAHFTTGLYDEKPFPELNFWVGGIDLPKDARKDNLFVELLRDGAVVAHSKRTLGFIGEGHFKRTKLSLFHPHTDRQTPNAELYMFSDLLVDGAYEVKITRTSDGKMIRSFDYKVAEKKVVPLKQTDLKFEPHVDHVLPRVQKKGVNIWGMEEAIWIRDGGNG